MWKSSPIESLSFSLSEMATRTYQIMSTLYYLHVYFDQNSKYDKFDLKKNNLVWATRNQLLHVPDKWVLSKLQTVISEVSSSFEKCKFHEAAKMIEEFIINTLSQTYVPVTRNEIWDDNKNSLNRRLAIYAVLGQVLKVVDVMLHPLSPYISDYLYLVCFSDRKSILLEDWPISDTSLVNKQVEISFDRSREIVSLSNAARMSAKLKRRWPIKSIWICSGGRDSFDIESILDILKIQINVQDCKVIRYKNDTKLRKLLSLLESEVPIIPRINLSKKNVGIKVKDNLEKVMQSFAKVDIYELLRTLEYSGKYLLTYDEGLLLEMSPDDVELSYIPAEGYALAENGDTMVFIDTRRDKDLVTKGLMRDLARNLQQLRKERGYNTTDIISSAYIAGLEEEEILGLYSMEEELKYLVRVNKMIITKESVKDIKYKMIDLEGRKLHLSI